MLINNYCGYCIHNDYYLTDSGIPINVIWPYSIIADESHQ